MVWLCPSIEGRRGEERKREGGREGEREERERENDIHIHKSDETGAQFSTSKVM